MYLNLNSPTILQVIPSFGQGGVEHATFEMAESLRDAYPHQETYVASSYGELLEKPHTFKHINLPLHSKNPFIIFLNAFRLKNIICQHKIDIVHARSRAPAWSAWLSCRMTKTPFITTYHAAYKGKNFLKKFYNSIMVRGSRVIAISNFIRQHIEKEYPWAKSTVIYEGIDIHFYTSDPCRNHVDSYGEEEKTKIIFIPSRMSSIKGIHIAIKAFAKVIEKNTDVKLMLIRTGKSHYIQEIDQLICDLNLGDHIIFVSPKPDLRSYYEMSCLVIVPSLVPEALGRVSLEALSMQKILIATDLGANLEICHHDETGYIVKAGKIDDLVKQITYCLFLDGPERERIITNGRTFVEKNF